VAEESIAPLLAEIRACRRCAADLPHGTRPVLQAAGSARLLLVGQAPGRRVHQSGTPYDDASGARLRRWLGLADRDFYDPALVAIQPMGFCYPGRGKSGDLPPRPECAPLWHGRLAAALPRIELTVLIGWHAMRFYLGRHRQGTLTETVRAWRDYGPRFFPVPHPSARNTAWFQHHPWFEAQVVPALAARVAALLLP
jgi:uracil-DNA glycosylase